MPIGPPELILLLAVLLLLFGAKKLPDLGRSLGDSITEFRKSTREVAVSDDEQPDGVA